MFELDEFPAILEKFKTDWMAFARGQDEYKAMSDAQVMEIGMANFMATLEERGFHYDDKTQSLVRIN